MPGQSVQTGDFSCVYFSQILVQTFLLEGLGEVFNAGAFCYSVQKGYPYTVLEVLLPLTSL